MIANEVITVPTGTSLRVRTIEGISSKGSRPEDTFRLTLDQSLVINGRTVAGAGSEVLGRVTHAKESGRVAGRAEIGFTLVQLKPSTSNQAYPIVTDNTFARAQGTRKRDAAMIGGGAGVGA